MNFRTDLALENAETDQTAAGRVKTRTENGCTVTTVTVGEQEAPRYEKPAGTYITVEVPPISDHIDGDGGYRALLGEELSRLLPEKGLALVAGLGNRAITPDALGPKTADQVLATRHVAGELEKLTGQHYFRPVAAVSPDVLGNTGVEAFEVLEGLVGQLKPAVVIAVDALAARRLDRLGCTVQLSDAGIAPGSGVGNSRPAISRETLGVPVIAMGVPTVVDGVTLVHDLLERHQIPWEESAEAEAAPRGAPMVVTPREIDLLITRAARLTAMAINTACNPCFDEETFAALL